ncbi:hypothetical protein P7K49_037054 [Saguinus oedipus]|uniref:Uncharacterized protein n=1 Tax=Saguinus oedipus TaxID=9490 RepID=A0ABQ9TLW6_SAGOE|nr:hypothetical protein P7K49_037054 [Saguinus oedipus]
MAGADELQCELSSAAAISTPIGHLIAHSQGSWCGMAAAHELQCQLSSAAVISTSIGHLIAHSQGSWCGMAAAHELQCQLMDADAGCPRCTAQAVKTQYSSQSMESLMACSLTSMAPGLEVLRDQDC